MQDQPQKPVGAVWRPVRDLPDEHRGRSHAAAREASDLWAGLRRRLEDPIIDRTLLDVWLREQKRAFAIETGQIEDLYQLARGVTETLITEGFEGVRGAHSVTSIDDRTLRGLLEDQEAALEMVFDTVRGERPISHHVIKEWHALTTRHQDTATGLDPFGNRVHIPLRRGQYKIRPNNPRRPDGHVHEYCPPEQVQSEMDRFLEFHRGHEALKLAPEVEAAWLHHEFVRIHPFQDGNGRISRLLMAWPYIRAGEFPPLITAAGKRGYIDALELADAGNFRAFVDYLGDHAAVRCREAARRAELVLAGRRRLVHANGGVTSNGVYHPPEPEPKRKAQSRPACDWLAEQIDIDGDAASVVRRLTGLTDEEILAASEPEVLGRLADRAQMEAWLGGMVLQGEAAAVRSLLQDAQNRLADEGDGNGVDDGSLARTRKSDSRPGRN